MKKKNSRRRYSACCCILATCSATFGSAGYAAVALDGTLGPAGALAGPDYVIPAEVGQIRGANLFQSFSQFSLTSGESATFAGPAGIHNIIGRVTGGEASSIDGTLASSIRGANLYLLNPSGIVFGPNGKIDVSGSFYASTADYLRFADGSRFDVRDPRVSRLSVASPDAFGFLGSALAPITVLSSLSVPTGATLGLIGGTITIAGKAASLNAPSGRIDLGAVASAGEWQLGANAPVVSAFAALGDITIRDGALVSTAGDPGGTIYIRGGRLVMQDGALDSSTLGPTDHPGTGIDIAVRGDVALTNGSIESSSFDAGRGGDIRIDADRLTMAGASDTSMAQIRAAGTNLGRGGDIDINASHVDIGANARIEAAGNVGAIRVNASDVVMTDGGEILSSADGAYVGAIAVTAQSVDLSGGAHIAMLSGGDGTMPGEIAISASRIRLTGGGGSDASIVTQSPPGTGDTRIRIDTRDLEVLDGATIQTLNLTSGGSIDVHADRVLVGGVDETNGRAAAIFTEIPRAILAEPLLAARATPPSGADGIDIEAREVVLRDHGTIAIEAKDRATLGQMRIEADDISLTGGAALDVSAAIGGSAGDVSLVAHHTLTVRDSAIRSNGFDGGGGIQIDAGKSVDLDNGAIVANVDGVGTAAGGVRISANTISLSHDSSVAATGGGGNIEMTARDAIRVRDSTISTQARRATGGNITISARSLLQLDRSAITASSSVSTTDAGIGNGGNIVIDPDFVVLNHSRISADAVGGNGGDVFIVAQNLFVSPDSGITASSTLGVQGDVVIRAPAEDLSRGLERLPETAPDASVQFKSSCAAAGGRFNRFTVPGPPVGAVGFGNVPSAYAGIDLATTSHNDTASRPYAYVAGVGASLVSDCQR